jgi:hypothetical protein
MPTEHEFLPKKLAINTCRELYDWYKAHLHGAVIIDPRGFRIRFLRENFIHLIKLKNKYGQEPRNPRLAIKEIEKGRIQLVNGRFDRQRVMELPWARVLATRPDCICKNWVSTALGDEAYVKNFGTSEAPLLRILICQILGKSRGVVTIFPRRTLGILDLRDQIWP